MILRGLGLATVCEFEWVEKQYSLRARTSDTNDTISVLVLGGMDSVIAWAPRRLVSPSPKAEKEAEEVIPGRECDDSRHDVEYRLPGCEIAMPQTHE